MIRTSTVEVVLREVTSLIKSEKKITKFPNFFWMVPPDCMKLMANQKGLWLRFPFYSRVQKDRAKWMIPCSVWYLLASPSREKREAEGPTTISRWPIYVRLWLHLHSGSLLLYCNGNFNKKCTRFFPLIETLALSSEKWRIKTKQCCYF